LKFTCVTTNNLKQINVSYKFQTEEGVLERSRTGTLSLNGGEEGVQLYLYADAGVANVRLPAVRVIRDREEGRKREE
jgi:hypothetical protein